VLDSKEALTGPHAQSSSLHLRTAAFLVCRCSSGSIHVPQQKPSVLQLHSLAFFCAQMQQWQHWAARRQRTRPLHWPAWRGRGRATTVQSGASCLPQHSREVSHSHRPDVIGPGNDRTKWGQAARHSTAMRYLTHITQSSHVCHSTAVRYECWWALPL
jgi:hypothetical protein